MEKQGFDLAMHYFRAFAIFSVISVHMWIVPPLEGHESMSRFLDMLRGVLFHSSTLYFVFISGYLFHFLAQRKFDLRTYYRKKLLNVIVPYVILSVFFTGYAFFWYSYTGEVPRFTKLATPGIFPSAAVRRRGPDLLVHPVHRHDIPREPASVAPQ